MKIIRYSDNAGRVRHAAQVNNGAAFDISGDIYSDFEVTDVAAQVHKLLAPVAPTSILGIGLNYRHHAEESGAKVPEYPVLFVKGLNTVQNPSDPIVIPTALRSEQVDYECELAVVIGKACNNVSREDAMQYFLC